MGFFIGFLVPIRPSKTDALSECIVTFLNLVYLCFFIQMLWLLCGLMPLPLQYIINRLPYSLLHGKSHFELLFDVCPNYAIFRSFGCCVFSYLRDYARDKLSHRSRPCIFLGYSSITKGFDVTILIPIEFLSLVMLNLTKIYFHLLLPHLTTHILHIPWHNLFSWSLGFAHFLS